jgi:glucose-6-phosphate isomerase
MTELFNVEGIKLDLGGYTSALQQWIAKATEGNLVERIWARDHTVWKPEPIEISNRLGWLDVAGRMAKETVDFKAFADEIKQAGMSKVLLLGMGGSSLAPELFANAFGRQESGIQLQILDSTDPEAVLAKALSHAPGQTLYIVSSKSGGTIETFSFFKYFHNRAMEELGAQQAGSHFIAITDPGSDLEQTASRHDFRRTFFADPNIGGRYSALSHFGLVPAALVGANLDRLLTSAERMATICRNTGVDQNPGALLGLALRCLAARGRDKATFLLPDDRPSFGDWVEQLIAESTGKEGKGILPVVNEPNLDIGNYGEDCVFIQIGRKISRLQTHPSISMDWQDDELGGLFFLWEFATAVAGYVLGINPFDQPNVEAAKVTSRHFVDEYKQSGKLPVGQAEPWSVDALNKFIDHSSKRAYISLQVYAAPSERLTETLQTLRGQLARKYSVSTTLGYGPRFLHSTGQLHKGDGGKGLFVQFVTVAQRDDVPIPAEAGSLGSEISFGMLKVAQARGDAEALRSAGRRVITFEVDGDLSQALRDLEIEKVGKHA